MAEKIYTLSQIAEHKSKKDCWLAINGRVLNVTRFLEEHPGGEEVLMEAAGKDATKQFEEIGHSKAAHELLFNYRVGVLQGYKLEDTETSNNASFQEPKKKEMEAFVVKGNGVPKYAALLEFFVPLLVAGSYFAYRYLA
ncbi:hypothetical protein AB3S75_014718 [Citrus x aurantiifolia]